MKNLGSRDEGARVLPAPAIHALLGARALSGGASPSARWGWVRGLNESGALEELEEDLVDKLVLSNGLDHEHPLLPEEPQHHGHFHFLRKERKHKVLRWGASRGYFLIPSSKQHSFAVHAQAQERAKDSAPRRFSQSKT